MLVGKNIYERIYERIRNHHIAEWEKIIIQGTGDRKPTGIVGSHGGDMDIDRLKELKAEFEEVRKYNDMHYMSTVTEDDVLELIDEAIARQSVTSEEVQRAIELLREPSKSMDYFWLDAQMHDALNLAITALQKIGTNTVDVAWTEAYQSYESAGDEAVPYCPKCDADLEDDQKFCKDCGVELIWSWDKENT